MKNFAYLLLFISFSICYGQDQTIDISSNIYKKEVPLEDGTHTFKLININPASSYNIKVVKEDFDIEVIKISSVFSLQEGATKKTEVTIIKKFSLKNGEKLIINVEEIKEDTAKGKTFIYTYNTSKRGEWRTTFGYNFVYLTNNNTYFSNANTNETFTVTEGNNKEDFMYYPTLMFTWVSKKSFFCNNLKSGLSGGLGYDLKSLSVFTGGSLIYNENITVTAGLAFHNQKRLSSNYSEGDILKENLDYNQLHTDYIRVNPFISISFRLDKTPFKN